MNSIIQNPHLFKDKVVMDVGCGCVRERAEEGAGADGWHRALQAV